MRKSLSFKITSDHLLLCVFLSLLWGVTDSNTTSTPHDMKATVTSSIKAKMTSTLLTTPMTTLSTTKAPPPNPEEVKTVEQNETTITLQWNQVNGNFTYRIEFDGRVENVSKSAGEDKVTYTVGGLTSGTKYVFTLFTVFENISSSGVNYTAATAPPNPDGFESITQTETTITLQWNQVDGNFTYRIEFDGRVENVSKSAGEDKVTYTVGGLTSGTKYVFTLFTVFENISSSGVNYTAATAPPNPDGFESITQTETTITLQWNQVDGNFTYRIEFDGHVENVSKSAGEDKVTYTVEELTSGTKYVFTLFTVFENISSSGVNYTAATAPRNPEEVKTVEQNETTITLQWNQVNDTLTYRIEFNGRVEIVKASAGEALLRYTVGGLTSGTKYVFTLFTVFENISSSGVNYTAATAPRNLEEVKTVEQTETTITLQWNQVNDTLTYRIEFDGRVENVKASAGEALLRYTVGGLTSGTKYVFTLFTVFENISSSGVNYTAATAPHNPEEVKTVVQNETTITLQWNQVNDTLTYRIEFDGRVENVSKPAGEDKVTYTVGGLTSGTKYVFTLFTVFENISSSGVNYTAATAPRNPEEVKTVEQTETTITLQWNQVNDTLTYRIEFDGRVENVKASAGEALLRYTVGGLTSGTKYVFTLFTVFENISSSGVNYTAATAPRNPEEVKTVEQNETTITLQWNQVNDTLTYRIEFNGRVEIVKASAREALLRYTVGGLTSGTKYVFTLFTVFENINSSGVNYTAATVPPVVALVNVTERSVTSITLAWNVDVDKDWSYLLQINGENLVLQTNKFSDVMSHSIPSLQPGTRYPFSLITMFFGHNSTSYEDFTVTGINCASVDWSVTTSSIQGMIEGLFTNATAANQSQSHVSSGGRGNVSFTGLYPGATYNVSLVYKSNSRSFLQCVHELTLIPLALEGRCEYLAGGYSISIVWNEPDSVWTAVEVNVTGKSHQMVKTGEQHVKLSGFQPARTYEVSLVALSGNKRSSEFIFSCTTDPRGVIAGSVFAVLLFGILVCVLVFILLKRPDIISRKKAFIGGSKQSNKKRKAISVTKFPDHFYQLSVDENRGFSEEYENLMPVGTEQTRKEALQLENKPRNRFNNVLPYDWCRVRLTTSNTNATSDYINASYMPGYSSNREYIATQGPLPSTINDFWRMIWEQRVKGIVMVTNCAEGGRTKCEQYWPADSEPCRYGELVVTMRSEQLEPNWTLREFRVKHSNTSEECTVKHFHFTAWPDHGVPESTDILIQFRGLVRQHIQREGSTAPTVVHCSAGVGRTGTIIALDVLLQQLDKERAVDINAFVHKMRLSRPHMVQTESQYVFLHQCIMDCLQRNEKSEENIYENAEMMRDNADTIYVNATALREFHTNA